MGGSRFSRWSPPATTFSIGGKHRRTAAGAIGRTLAVPPARWRPPPPSPGQWRDWGPGFGGPAAAAPTVAQNADGRLELFILGPGGSHLEHRWQVAPNGAWSDWYDFGGLAGSLPAAGRNANGQL